MARVRVAEVGRCKPFAAPHVVADAGRRGSVLSLSDFYAGYIDVGRCSGWRRGSVLLDERLRQRNLSFAQLQGLDGAGPCC